MTDYDAYIGNIDDFDFDGDGEGNCPGRLSPYFPPTSDDNVFERVCALNAIPTDWGTHVLVVKKARLLKIIDKWYGSDKSYTDPTYMPHLYEKLEELKRFVNTLDDKKNMASSVLNSDLRSRDEGILKGTKDIIADALGLKSVQMLKHKSACRRLSIPPDVKVWS